ncbi:PD-(D/E)XK nuclease family protein [Pseudorhodoplanes sp.]|uniref:PD-(D/E)XK nuclease family protein n=1 Tax=Pseudorhodoplanes sp. TaxID=1934341 RepID=UPI003D11196A
MLVPTPPALTELHHITASIYNASIECLAKAAWYALGGRGVIPEHPSSILGTSFHAVVGAAHRGSLPSAGDGGRNSARELFDSTARMLYAQAQPLVRLKFPTPERLPYYNMQRERAARLAMFVAASRPPAAQSFGGMVPTTSRPAVTEPRLCSSDALIVGRPDHIDRNSRTVIDYKSGYIDGGDDPVSDSEARQLRIYAYLANENGLPVSNGAIVRGDGRRSNLPISRADAEAEASGARAHLHALNTAISGGARFSTLASPSPQACRTCPCIPLCGSFWDTVQPEWQSECGVHVEGRVLEVDTRSIQAVSFTTIGLAVRSGTISGGRASIEQVPTEWMMVDENNLPHPGETMRVVHGRLFGTQEEPTIIRVDKTATAVWRSRSQNSTDRQR